MNNKSEIMFEISESDIQRAKDILLISQNPLQIKQFPAREKKKYILLCMICHLFVPNKNYTEPEVNDILRNVYEDYVTIRRYLIIYHFLDRTPDGYQYWLIADLEKFNKFK